MADPLQKNANRLLREAWRSTTAFAQEVYTIVSGKGGGAMSASSSGVQARRPTTQAPTLPPGRSPQSSGPSGGPRNVDDALRSMKTAAQALREGGRSRDLGFTPASASTPGMPAPIDLPRSTSPPAPAEPLRTKPYRMDPPFPDYDYNLDLPLGEGGTSGLNGIVVGGSGDQPSVDLYENGSRSASTGNVTVNILQLADGENIPNGTWITGIQKFSDSDDNAYYEAQVPVWLS